jgi:hypothetical protein
LPRCAPSASSVMRCCHIGSHVSTPCHQSKGGKLRRIKERHKDTNRLKLLHSHRIYPRAHTSVI